MGGAQDLDVLSRWLGDAGITTLDRITGGSQDVVGVMDREYVLRYVNWTAPGLTREGVVGHSVFNLVPPGYAEIARAAFDQVLQTGVPARFEMLFSNEVGMLIWVVRVGPIRHEGEVIGAFTINTDVTEQRRESVDRDRFFSLSLDMLIVATHDARLKRVNPAFSEALGYPAAELMGKPFLDFIHPEDRAKSLAAFQLVLDGAAVSDFENRYRRRDAAFRIFSWRATVDPITGDVYAVARDITEQRGTEAQLRHVLKMEAIGQLAGGVAHDFNNLVQAVLTNVDLALATASPTPSVIEHLNEIAGAGLRAADLTRQLLMFSRRQPLHRVPVDLNALLNDLMKLLQRLLPENIAIAQHLGHRLAMVGADRTQLEQVIVNLCVNARDAMENGGKLTIETDQVVFDAHDCELHPWAKPGCFVRMSITDTGVGMSAEVRERVFDPFFTTKGNQRGTGLGLATVYGIVQQHGGLVHVYSEVGQGATFKVYLPTDERPAPKATADESSRASRHGSGTILIAEDEELVRRPVVQMLQRAGYQTLTAVNGADAIRILNEHPNTIDLVVLDVVMPELGGPETWQRMRIMQPGLRVIFTSGYADDRYQQRLPPDAEVLAKPFRGEELLRRIQQTLGG